MNLLNKYSINKLSCAIIRNLDDKYLKKEYLFKTERNNVTGHCYLASEVFYHLTGGKKNGFLNLHMMIKELIGG